MHYQVPLYLPVLCVQNVVAVLAAVLLPAPSNNHPWVFRMLLLLQVLGSCCLRCQVPLYSNYDSYAFRMLLLVLGWCCLWCTAKSPCNYHSCAFQDAVVAVGSGGVAVCHVLVARYFPPNYHPCVFRTLLRWWRWCCCLCTASPPLTTIPECWGCCCWCWGDVA